jgi:hypothetical protein
VDPRAVLDNVDKRKFLALPGLELRPIGRLVHSQSLYRLRYPDSQYCYITSLKENMVNVLVDYRGMDEQVSEK